MSNNELLEQLATDWTNEQIEYAKQHVPDYTEQHIINDAEARRMLLKVRKDGYVIISALYERPEIKIELDAAAVRRLDKVWAALLVPYGRRLTDCNFNLR